MLDDLRLAIRALRRAPAYAISALLALAIAIGANTALFSLIEATLLRPYPYPRPEQLMLLRENTRQFDNVSVSFPNFQDWRAQTKDLFSGMAAFRRESFNLTGSGDPDRLTARLVASDFFGILGASPQLGRTFSAADDAPGAPRTAVLSNALWQKRFASDPRVIGQRITLSGDSYVVVGVMPPGFRFLSASDLFLPIGLWGDLYKDRDSHPGIGVISRLKAGVTMERARAALDAVAERLGKEYPRSNLNHGVSLQSLHEDQTRDFRAALFVLWGAVALVLLIAAANVANLALARAAARTPELTIRAALGAGRARLIRELLTESVLLSVAGGALGVLFAVWGLAAMMPWVPESLRRTAEVQVNASVLAFTLVISVATGLLFGVLPALRASRPDLDSLLREARATDPRSRRRLRSALVVAEIALSLMLLIGAGLLVRSFSRAMGIDNGFRPAGLLTLQLALPEGRYADSKVQVPFTRELRRRLGTLPGVKSVAISGSAPLVDDNTSGRRVVSGL